MGGLSLLQRLHILLVDFELPALDVAFGAGVNFTRTWRRVVPWSSNWQRTRQPWSFFRCWSALWSSASFWSPGGV